MSCRPHLAICAALFASPVLAASGTKLVVGQPAPAFSVTTIDKRAISLADLKGKVVLLNYWATWCAPCKAEMPMMNEFYLRYKGAGFETIGVTTEDSVPAYKLKKLDAVLAYSLAARSKTRAYEGSRSVPTSYVIDRKGVLRHIQTGAFEEAEFNALLLPLLAEAK